VATARPKYRRVLLKLSGEAFGQGSGKGLHLAAIKEIAREVADLAQSGVQMGVVIGGGNIVRGAALAKSGISVVAGDTMGMLATVINGLAFQDVLETKGVATRLQTAIPMHAVAEPFIRRRAMRHLEKGRVVIFAAGTGSPHFTTDTAAALRAREVGADVLLKATNVDGVYSDDPNKNSRAKKYERLTYDDLIHRKLRVMDATAVTLCREGKLPVIVLNMTIKGNIRKAIFGKSVGTYIGEK
jgi:uridylate kinase